MKYFLDSVNINEIEKQLQFIDGVTSNPILLDEAKINSIDFLKSINNFNFLKFVQVSSTNIEQLDYILASSDFRSSNIIFKVSMHPDNYDLIKKLKNAGCKVSATTIYDIIQVNQAIEMGCDYTMVYYHKNNYKNLMIDAYELKQKTNSNIKLVGASIRTPSEVIMAIESGMDYVTIKSNVMEETFYNKQLNDDLKIINNLI